MHEVLRGAMVALPLRLVSGVLSLGLNVLLAHVLGNDDMGLYFLALTITTIATAFATMGLGNVLVRHTAAGVEQNDWASVQTVARKGTGIALLCAAGLTVILAFTAPWLSEFVLGKPELTTPLQWMALSIVPQTQVMLHSQLLRGLKRIAVSQFLRNIDVPILTMVFLIGFGGIFGVTGAVWSYCLASFITAIMAFGVWKRAARKSEISPSPYPLRSLLSSGFPLLLTDLLNLLIHSATILMLGAMSTTAAVALYGVAFRVVRLIRLVLMAVNTIAGPKFAALHSTADIKSLSTTSRRSTLLMTLIATPVLVFIFAFPQWIMGLFGESYIAGASILLILAFGQFIAVLFGSVGYLLMMSGNEKLLRNNTMIAAAVNLLLNAVLIPELGAKGAAISVAAAMILRSLLGAIQVYRSLGITPFFLRTPVESPEGSSKNRQLAVLFRGLLQTTDKKQRL